MCRDRKTKRGQGYLYKYTCVNHDDSKLDRFDSCRMRKSVLMVVQTIDRLLTKNKLQNGLFSGS